MVDSRFKQMFHDKHFGGASSGTNLMYVYNQDEYNGSKREVHMIYIAIMLH